MLDGNNELRNNLFWPLGTFESLQNCKCNIIVNLVLQREARDLMPIMQCSVAGSQVFNIMYRYYLLGFQKN